MRYYLFDVPDHAIAACGEGNAQARGIGLGNARPRRLCRRFGSEILIHQRMIIDPATAYKRLFTA